MTLCADCLTPIETAHCWHKLDNYCAECAHRHCVRCAEDDYEAYYDDLRRARG